MKKEEIIKAEPFPFFKKVWLIMELARTNNQLEIKNKYKRIFKTVLPDSVILETIKVHVSDIAELKSVARLDLESHELSSPYKRMEYFEQIRIMCMEGFENGVDAMGAPSIKKDPAGALKALTAARDESNIVIQNELKLLQIYVQGEKLKLLQSPGPLQEHGEPPPDNKKISTDTDQFFKNHEF